LPHEDGGVSLPIAVEIAELQHRVESEIKLIRTLEIQWRQSAIDPAWDRQTGQILRWSFLRRHWIDV
jgi:hypothetical protein